MSWLYPVTGVQRSALASKKAAPPVGDVNVKPRFVGSIGTKVCPSLPAIEYWLWLSAVKPCQSAGMSCAVRRVLENVPLASGPAPAKIVPGSLLLLFHCSLTV